MQIATRTLQALLALAMFILAAPVLAQAPADGPCSGPESEQFDFWLGTWEVQAKGKVVGRNVITKIHGGCTVLESYTTGPGGFEGGSFNYFEPSDESWHQVWVDNSGTRLHLKGAFAGGQMVLSGSRIVGGEEVIDRITWTDNPDGSVRQQWDQSADLGVSWKPLFDGTYLRIDDESSEAPEQR